MKVFLDTNVYISSAISPSGAPHRVVQAWRAERFVVLYSAALISELTGVLGRPAFHSRYNITDDVGVQLLNRLQTHGDLGTEYERVPPVLVRDQQDEHILAAAVAGHADYLVTGDRDLLVLDGDPALGSLRIVTPAAFLSILDRPSAS